MLKQIYANVEWTVNDVMENSKQFGIQITKADAEKVLKIEEGRIIDAMVEAGWLIIEDALMERQR